MKFKRLIHAITALIQITRPFQWPKNLFLYAPAFFGGLIHDALIMKQMTLGFAAFCMISGAGYVINDLHDCYDDQNHPVKCNRPIASGRISSYLAMNWTIALVTISIITASCLGSCFMLWTIAYLVLVILYTYKIKPLSYLNTVTVTVGFLIRLCAGGAIADIPISGWLFVSVFILSLFLGHLKRFWDEYQRNPSSVNQLNIEQHQIHDIAFSSQILLIMNLAIYIGYILFTFKSLPFAFTIFPVAVGLYRAVFLVYKKAKPVPFEWMLLGDWLLIFCFLVWLGSWYVLLYP